MLQKYEASFGNNSSCNLSFSSLVSPQCVQYFKKLTKIHAQDKSDFIYLFSFVQQVTCATSQIFPIYTK